MKFKQFLAPLIVLLVVGAIAVALFSRSAQKIQPIDASPTPTSSPVLSTFEARIGEKVGNSNISITPIAILEDSRCPLDVQCIQKGTVRLQADIFMAGTKVQRVFSLEVPLSLADQTVTLIKVTPESTTMIDRLPGSYRFTFEVKK